MSRLTRLPALAALALLAACGPGDLGVVEANLSVSPGALDFGDNPVLAPKVLELVLSNTGATDLEIFNLSIAGEAADAAAFTIVPESLTGEVIQLSDHTLRIQFEAAEMRPYAAKLVIESDDPDEPTIEIPLTGAGTTAADATIEPDALDFGRVGEGRSSVQRVKITSTGTADLLVKQVEVLPAGGPFSIVGSNRATTVRARKPGEEDAFVEITVKFAPAPGVTITEGKLVIVTSAPALQTKEITLTGQINRQPVAVPGADQILPPGRLVTLDGSASSDPDNDVPLAFAWTLVEKPQGSATELSDPTQAVVNLTPDFPGLYLAELVVTDAAGLASKPVRVRVNAATSDNLVVELVWDHPVADLDLHFREEGSAFDSLADAFGANPSPDFGANGDPTDDPFHTGDKLSGFGPERVVYEDPRDGEFRIAVKYVSAQGSENRTLNATVRVYMYGVIRSETSLTLTQPGQVWEAALVTWPSGTVTPGAGVTP